MGEDAKRIIGVGCGKHKAPPETVDSAEPQACLKVALPRDRQPPQPSLGVAMPRDARPRPCLTPQHPRDAGRARPPCEPGDPLCDSETPETPSKK